MRFATPLIPARLTRRYKRFLADMVLDDGREIIVHCANPGAMTGLADPGARCWIEPNDDPRKRLDFGWRLVELADGGFAGVDTMIPNRVVKAALEARAVPGLPQYDSLRAEVPYGKASRIDFVLGSAAGDIHVEVKSVTLSRQPGLAEFPDSRTARGLKHLGDLAEICRHGGRAIMLYLVQRTDAVAAGIAADIDPAYAAGVAAARAAGVQVVCLGTTISPLGISVAAPLLFHPPVGSPMRTA